MPSIIQQKITRNNIAGQNKRDATPNIPLYGLSFISMNLAVTRKMSKPINR
jgi:hypothetical protein